MARLSAEGEVGDGDVIHHDIELAGSLRQTVPHLPPCMRNQVPAAGLTHTTVLLFVAAIDTVSKKRTARETLSRCVRSCSALYCATTAFTISLPMDGSTRSSQSVPRFCAAK